MHYITTSIKSIVYSHKAAKVEKVVYEFEEVADVIGDGRTVWIHLSQVLLIDLAHPYRTKFSNSV